MSNNSAKQKKGEKKMKNNFLEGLGLISLIIITLCLIFIPIIIGIVIAMAVADYFKVSGLLWWCIVAFVTLVILGVLRKLSN